MTLLNELQFKFTLPQKTLFTSSNNIVILEIDQYFTVSQENSYEVKFQLSHSFLTDRGGNYLCTPLWVTKFGLILLLQSVSTNVKKK